MKILLIVDMLNDFAAKGGALYCGKAAGAIIPFIKKLAAEYRKKGGRVIYICDAHSPDDVEFRMFAPHALKGSKGARIIKELKPGKDDIVVEKATYSAFHETALELFLKEFAPEEVGVVGVCASICVMETVRDLRLKGYGVAVYKKGVADFSRTAHAFALKRMKEIYGAVIR